MARPKRSGDKLHGRIVIITHPDGKTESHLLPSAAIHRDLTAAKITFEQWDGDCLCSNWREYTFRHFKQFKILRGMRLLYRGFIRFLYG